MQLDADRADFEFGPVDLGDVRIAGKTLKRILQPRHVKVARNFSQASLNATLALPRSAADP
jgi:hypothetical protein